MRFARAFVLGAIIGVCGATVARAAEAPARAEFHHSYPLSATGTLRIDDARGSIRVIGWDRNSAQVDAVECAPTAADLKSLTISVDSKPNAVNVQTVFPPISEGWLSWVRLLGWSTWCNERPEVDYIVHVPARARVALTGASADMSVAGPIGPLKVDTASGDLSATDVGDVTVNSQSGTVTLTRARGTFALTTTSGDVLFNEASGDVTVSSTSGEIRLFSVSGKAVVTTTSGDITARSFSGVARLSSTSGDVSMTLARRSGVALSAGTVSGEIQSDIPLRTRAPIDVRTISGDISVRSL